MVLSPVILHVPPVLPVLARGHHRRIASIVKVVQRVPRLAPDPVHIPLTSTQGNSIRLFSMQCQEHFPVISFKWCKANRSCSPYTVSTNLRYLFTTQKLGPTKDLTDFVPRTHLHHTHLKFHLYCKNSSSLNNLQHQLFNFATYSAIQYFSQQKIQSQ